MTQLAPRMLIVSSRYPPATDGVGDYSSHLRRALAADGVPCSVLTTTPGPPEPDVLRRPLRWDLAGVCAAAREAARGTEDTVCLQYVPHMYARRGVNPFLPLLPLLVRRAGRRVVTTFHELWIVPDRLPSVRGGLAAVLFLQAALIAHSSDVVVTTTPLYARRLRRAARLPAHKIHALPVGSNVNPAPLSAAERERRRQTLFGEGALVLATFGRLQPWQSLDRMIQALRLLSRAGVRAGLLAIGDGPRSQPALYHKLQLLAEREGVADRILWTGELSGREVSEHLQLADIYCAATASGISTRSGSVMAALAHGLPVVATGIEAPEARFVDRTHVWLTGGGQPAQIADAVAALHAAPERARELGEAGRRLYESAFSWSQIGAAYRRILDM